MSVGRIVALWIARHLLAFVLILGLLVAGRYLFLPAWNWAQNEIEEARRIAEARRAIDEAEERLRAYGAERQSQAQSAIHVLPANSTDRLRQRLAQIPTELEGHRRFLLSTPGLAWAAGAGQSDRLFAHFRAGVEIGLLNRERQAIEALLQARIGQSRQLALSQRRAEAVIRYREAQARLQQAQAKVDELERRPLAKARNALCQTVRPIVGCDNYRALESARQARDRALADTKAAVTTVRAVDRVRSTMAAAHMATADASSIAAEQIEALQGEKRRLEAASSDNFLLWLKRPIIEMLPTALSILAVAILGPALVKAFFYFLVAPLAERQAPVHLERAERGRVDTGLFRSAASQRIDLRDDEELLVVPEAVQTSPNLGSKSTKWFLNPRFPFTSIASGLVALVRFRGGSEFVEIIATGDPFAEIALVGLPRGSAMVVKPRSLRGVIHPISDPVIATRYWRFGRSAWLALRFRYLVLHGPCVLILQGSRGLRLERAAQGRSINRAATLAFSAGLGLSVRRSEAFAPYLMGRQDLLNHSFAGDAGYIVSEERPRAGQRTGLWGRGLAGLADAALKPFGL